MLSPKGPSQTSPVAQASRSAGVVESRRTADKAVAATWNLRPGPAPLARLAGFEPATHGLEVRCSIQLSYRRTSPRPSWPPAGKRAGDGVRTRDIQLGRLTLCQLSYTRPPESADSSGTWSGREDLNLRPPAPKAGALPGCATSRQPHCSGFGRESIAYKPASAPRASPVLGRRRPLHYTGYDADDEHRGGHIP